MNYKLNEMTRMSRSGGGLGLLADPAGPIFRNAAGEDIDSVICGEPFSFEVPGYSRVFLQRSKDGVPIDAQAFDVPMPAYSSSCSNDVGHYEIIVSDLNSGQEIGRTNFDILPDGGGMFSGISATTLLIGGAALLFLLSKKKRRS